MHWASEQESQVSSERKRTLRGLEEERRTLNSELEDLQKQTDHLLAIIEGKVKPSAVDLPEEEAADFRTKLRLRVKGVRGIAIEKARADLIPIEGKIEGIEGKLEGLEERSAATENRSAEALKAVERVGEAIRRQRDALRELRRVSDEISGVTGLLGWQNPYLLFRKSLEEIMIASRKLDGKHASVGKRRQEIREYEDRIAGIKGELESALGEAYEGSFMPLIFKDGRSPMGKRYLQDELTLKEVTSLDIPGKISRHKTMGRRADRLSTALRNHRLLIEDSLIQIARLCELRMYTTKMLGRASKMEKATLAILETKIALHHRIMTWAEECGKVGDMHVRYLTARNEASDAKKHTIEKVSLFRSDL